MKRIANGPQEQFKWLVEENDVSREGGADHLVFRFLKPQEQGKFDMVVQRGPGLNQLLCSADDPKDGPVRHLQW